jgi:hypothetical protein
VSNFGIILAGAALLILVWGLIYTIRNGKVVSTRQSELDTEINEKTQNHPMLLNPIFLAYIIGIGLAILYIVYQAINYQ